eukprot:scaffold7385_cov533-Prasinococcus_capsulatus_cf.AAC.9
MRGPACAAPGGSSLRAAPAAARTPRDEARAQGPQALSMRAGRRPGGSTELPPRAPRAGARAAAPGARPRLRSWARRVLYM